MTKFYRAKFRATEQGLQVYTTVFVSVHETPHMHFCVHEVHAGYDWEKVKELKIPVTRIHKDGSRIAKPTPEDAFEHLKFRTLKRKLHLKRELALTVSFLDGLEDRGLSELKDGVVPDTLSTVQQYYLFD